MAIEKERRKAVTLAALVVCMAAPGAILAQRFPRFVWIWIALMLVVLIIAGVQFAKLKGKRP
jgi:TctA family transporter